MKEDNIAILISLIFVQRCHHVSLLKIFRRTLIPKDMFYLIELNYFHEQKIQPQALCICC